MILKDITNEKTYNFLLLFFRYFSKFYFNPFVTIKLRQFIQKIKPDIIHIHGNDRYGISVLIALLNLRIPIIQTIHSYTILCASLTFKKPSGDPCLYSQGIRCIFNRCVPLWKFLAIVPSYAILWALTKHIVEKIIVANPRIQERLKKCGYSRTVLIEHFVDKFENNLENFSTENGNILCVGRLSWEKGFQYVIKAMVNVKREMPRVSLHICGDGPYIRNLKQMVHSLHISDAVIFHGHLDSQKLVEFYKKANLIVFPSLCLEICGLVNLEALAYGKPLIISNICGIEEIFQGKKIGFFVDPRNTIELSNSILKILTNQNLFIEMSKNAFEMYQERFNPEVHYRKLISVYQSLL